MARGKKTDWAGLEGGGGPGSGWRSLSSINAAGKGRRDAVGVAFSARREEDMLRPLPLSDADPPVIMLTLTRSGHGTVR
jgi:hypothetical protein